MRRTPAMNPRTLGRIFAKVTVSLLCAGLFYSIWLAAFLLATNVDTPAVETVAWLSAPVVTAAGFAVGVAAFERLTRASQTSFLRIFVWPLIGCTLGAGIVYWFGPMLIVFGMFGAGTASIALRETILIVKKGED
jgi:hypothetical protein